MAEYHSGHAYALSESLRDGLAGEFDMEPYPDFDHRWVSGDYMIFRLKRGHRCELALDEMSRHATRLSLEITRQLVEQVDPEVLDAQGRETFELIVAASPWHRADNATWTRKTGQQAEQALQVFAAREQFSGGVLNQIQSCMAADTALSANVTSRMRHGG